MDNIVKIECITEEIIKSKKTGKTYNNMEDFLKENKIEDLMFHKYVVPTLENIAKAEANIYDDWRLRGTIKQGQDKDRKNAEYIVNELSSRLSDTKYFAQRYK